MSDEPNELSDEQRASNALRNILMSAVNKNPNMKLPPQAKVMGTASITTPAMFLHAIVSGPQDFRDIIMNIDPLTLLSAVVMMNSMVYALDEEQAKDIHKHVTSANDVVPNYFAIIGSLIGAVNLTGGKSIVDNAEALSTLHNLYLAGSAHLQAQKDAQAKTDAAAEGSKNAAV